MNTAFKFPDLSKSSLDEKFNNDVCIINNKNNSALENNNIFEVGRALNEIKNEKLYKLNGYKSFLEFTKDLFKFNKNKTYNLINIYVRFNELKFKEYNYSQLAEMLLLTDEEIEEITPECTVMQIRNIKAPGKFKECKSKENDEIKKELEIQKQKNFELEEKLKDLQNKIKEKDNLERAAENYLVKTLEGKYKPKWILKEQEPLIYSESDFTMGEINAILFHLKLNRTMKPALFKNSLEKGIYFFEHLKSTTVNTVDDFKDCYIDEMKKAVERIKSFYSSKDILYSFDETEEAINFRIKSNFEKENISDIIGENISYRIKSDGHFDRITIRKYS